MNSPLISVITVVYNTEKTIETTIRSVLAQKNSLFEYWIIDGDSTDNTTNIIKIYEDKLAGWVCEPDKGIYDAMNKGIDKVLGAWVYFLGADDTLIDGILEEVEPYLLNSYDLVYGDIITDTEIRVPSFINSRILLQNTLHHQGAFYNKNLFKDFRYDTDLSIISDYELNLKIYIQNLKTKRMPMVIAKCTTGGASSSMSVSLKETNKIRRKYIKNIILNKLLSGILWLYYSQKKIRKIFI